LEIPYRKKSPLPFTTFDIDREQSRDELFIYAEIGEREPLEGGAKLDETLLRGIGKYP
jgi:hypothetical protein